MSRWLSLIVMASMLCLLGFDCGKGEESERSPTASEQASRPGKGHKAGPPPRGKARHGQRTALGAPVAGNAAEPEAYVNFVINVHDFVNLDESASIVTRLVDLFERYGVRGEFYVTAPMIHHYSEHHPEVIAKLKNSDQTISYHHRAPHPATPLFGDRLKRMKGTALAQELRNYETYRLDQATGELITDEWGGYSYVKQALGRAPVVASQSQEGFRPAGLALFAELGAQATVVYHEEETDLNEPYKYAYGLLERPSDLGLTSWSTKPGEKPAFWWNMLDRPGGTSQTPKARLQTQLASWSGDRPPFVTALIHENNFYRRGATPWAQIYYEDRDKTKALRAPYDLDSKDASRARAQGNKDAIWAAYEEVVAYAAKNLQVVTSEDIVALAAASRGVSAGTRSARSTNSGARKASGDGSLMLGMMVHLEGWKGENANNFQRQAEHVREAAEIFERHGAKLTLEAKEPLDTIPRYGDNYLAELEARGHAVGVHADKGFSPKGAIPLGEFTRDLTAMQRKAKALGVNSRHVSGVCSASDWVTASIQAGYRFTSGDVGFCYAAMDRDDRPVEYRDCTTPMKCHDPAIKDLARRIHPWRAAKGSTWTEHDPRGGLVILPSSSLLSCYGEISASATSPTRCDFDAQDIRAFTKELDKAIGMVDPDKVNILYVSWSLGEALDSATLERWLSAIDPYVAKGQVQWATLPEMYDAYVANE